VTGCCEVEDLFVKYVSRDISFIKIDVSSKPTPPLNSLRRCERFYEDTDSSQLVAAGGVVTCNKIGKLSL
jgi:hypothetical protein